MFKKAFEVRLEDFQSLILLSQSLAVLEDENLDEIKKLAEFKTRNYLKLNPDDPRALSLGALHIMNMGKSSEAIEWIEKAIRLYPDDSSVLLNGACTFANYGDKQRALDLLEISFGKGFGRKDWIENDPDYDSLREEPRFKALMSKLK